ncbi:hypothetical protein [Anaerovibrio lipolyticus]|uniref:hypothetical protein n=1 Tax=Anaerovibrio lipolyticus TaxID=82374 RepID=UPI0026E9DC0C|nr:hypothetical protein [Anaerovibrio lipolyticus]MBE6105722.1 hypothetical protein [Anaerovibrio lipolyticus]
MGWIEISFIIIMLIYIYIGNIMSFNCVKELINYLLNSMSSSASIVGFVTALFVYKKIKKMSSTREKIDKMINAMGKDNNYHYVGLNMKIDLLSSPSKKIKDIICCFEKYNKCIDIVASSNNNTKSIWEYKNIAIPNKRNQIKLLLLALEIQILELEVLNSTIPLPTAIEDIDQKRDNFIDVAKNTKYVD